MFLIQRNLKMIWGDGYAYYYTPQVCTITMHQWNIKYMCTNEKKLKYVLLQVLNL